MDVGAACGRAAQCVRDRPKTTAGACGAFLALLAIILSFSSLEYTELGLNINHITNYVDPQGFTAGLYFLGLGHSFIRYPSTVQNIQFTAEDGSAGPAMRSRTSDGLDVQLEVSFQYQLNVSAIYNLYEKFGTNYEPILINMAIDLVTAKATNFNAGSFFGDRNRIGLEMEKALRNTFDVDAFSGLPFFQLLSVSLPKEFELAIQETEVARQDISTAYSERNNTRVQMDSKILQAQQNASQIEITANATAQSILLSVDAYVKQFNLSQRLQANSFAPLYQKLGENDSLLMEYMKVRAMRDHPDHLSVVGVPQHYQ